MLGTQPPPQPQPNNFDLVGSDSQGTHCGGISGIKRLSPLDTKHAFSALKGDSLYNLSVALMASAKLKLHTDYIKNLKDIKSHLSKARDNSNKAWMLGRIALSASQMDDKATVASTLIPLKSILKNSEVEKDAYYAWALGYIAAIDTREYEEHKTEMLSVTDHLARLNKSPSDVLWAYVIDLQAAATAKDKNCFGETLEKIKTFVEKEMVTDALSVIPQEDWRAWALGITLKATAMIGNIELYKELIESTYAAVIDARNAGKMANALLAQLDMESAALLIIKP